MKLEKEYDALLVYNEDLEKLEDNLEKSNRDYIKVYDNTKQSLLDAKNNISICTTKIE